MPTQQELIQSINQLQSRIQTIKEQIAETDQQIKNSSINNVDKIETELAELKNSYYEVQVQELLGEYDARKKREIEEKIAAAEKHLKTESGVLQNLLGIRHALERELKTSQSRVDQQQIALEKLEFENLKLDRQRLVEEIQQFSQQLVNLFNRVVGYNEASIQSATRILDREYQLKGYPNGLKGNGTDREQVRQLAQPLDLNVVKSVMAETLSEIASSRLAVR